MAKTCFVICPIGDVGTPIRQDADDFMEYIVKPCPALKEMNYNEPVRADRLSEPGRITSQVIELLINADLVIADLTGNNANVFYELSLRHAVGKPSIHMAHVGTPVSFDVRDNRTIFYTMHSRVAEAARTELAAQIRRVHAEGYKCMNPILETAGIIDLQRSTNPEQNTLAKVLLRLEQLDRDMSTLQTSVGEIHARSVPPYLTPEVSATVNALRRNPFSNLGLGTGHVGDVGDSGRGILSDVGDSGRGILSGGLTAQSDTAFPLKPNK